MDKIDKKLITLLQNNARMPLKALAENVFLSSPAVSARIERLEKEEIIEGYKSDLKEEKLKSRPLHECSPEVLVWLQNVYANARLEFSKADKDYLLKRIKTIANSKCYDVRDSGKCNVFELAMDSDLKAPELNMPAIIHNKTDNVVLPGKLFLPSFMMAIPADDIRLLPNGNCLFRQKTDNGSIVKLIDTEGNKLKEIKFPKKESVK